MIKKRKIPQRICIGCQVKLPKKELVRVVRTPDSQVVVDATGKKPGRGAYICPKESCLSKAAKGKRLEKNLQLPVSEKLFSEIREMLEIAKEQ